MISENVQIYPATIRVEPNDKASKMLFNINPEHFAKMIQKNARQGVIEKKNHKKHGKIKSTFQLYNENGYTQILQLTEFDRAVLSVCISEWENGNRYTTPAIIYRGLTGKTTDGGNGKIQTDQRAAILQSIDKLMCTLYDPQIVEAYEKLKYDTTQAEKIVKAPLLPCKRTQKTVNGKVADLIYFTDEPATLTIANIKSQIIRYPVELLDVPNQQNTPRIIAVKNYILRRVFEIQNHKMTPTITLDDVFTKIRITDADSKIKSRVREYINVFFEHLQKKGVIKSFQWTKKGNKFYSVNFTF